MANPKIYAQNLGRYSSLAASAGSNASYPLTNLQDYLRASMWKSAATTSGQYLTVALDIARECDFVIIDNNNLYEAGVTLEIEAADDAAMTVNKVDLYQGNVPQTQSYDGINMTSLIEFEAAATKQYWRFTFTGSPIGDEPTIGNLFLGKLLEFSFPFDFGAKAGDSSFQTVVGRSLSGTKRASQAVGGTRLFRIRFTLISDAAAALYRTFHDTIRGALRPFYYSPDGGTTLYYVSNTKDYSPVTMYRPGQNNIEEMEMETADSEVT